MQFSTSKLNRNSSLHRLGVAFIALALLSGCRQWPNTAQFQQAQVDNERLLTELRAQKKRADETQARLELAQKKVDEVERLYAKDYNSRPTNRLSSTDTMQGRANPAPSFSPGYSSLTREDPKSLEPRSTTLGSGAPLPSTSGNRSSAETPKWRPARKSQ